MFASVQSSFKKVNTFCKVFCSVKIIVTRDLGQRNQAPSSRDMGLGTGVLAVSVVPFLCVLVPLETHGRPFYFHLTYFNTCQLDPCRSRSADSLHNAAYSR